MSDSPRLPKSLFDISAERAFLGACLLDNEVLAWANVSSRCFYDPRCRSVFDAMSEAAEERQALDVVTLGAVLKRHRKLDAVGGEPFLGELAVEVPTSHNAQFYVDILQEKRMGRELFVLACAARTELEHGRPDEVLSSLMRKASAIDSGKDDSTTTLGAAIQAEVKSLLKDLDTGASPKALIRTGLVGFDEIIGGLPVGIPSLLGAPPATGKSAFALKMVRYVAENDGGAVLLTYEDRHATWAQRTIADLAGVDLSRIRRRSLTRDEIARVVAAEQMVSGIASMRDIDIVHAHGQRVPWLIRKARALKKRTGARLFVVDYMQLIPNPNPREFRKKDESVGENLRLLAELAGEDDVAVLVLWQLTREFEKAKTRPSKTDFADSSAAERYGKFNMALWEPPNDEEQRIELCIVKNNNGPIGDFKLPFNRPFMRIGNQ